MLGATSRSSALVDGFAALESADFRDPLNYEDLNDPVSAP